MSQFAKFKRRFEQDREAIWQQIYADNKDAIKIKKEKFVLPNLKVIIESAAQSDDEIVDVCRSADAAGAYFVNTSTGFHPAGGASVHAVSLMKETVGDRLGVKASGGIRDAETALSMVSAGATRLGLSSSKAVLDGLA